MKDFARRFYFYLALAMLLAGAMTADAQVTGLSFRPVDAAYSLALDRIILISANPNQLHSYDPVAQADQTIALSAAPQSVSLSSDGTHAAVAFSNAVAYVDLQGMAVSKIFSNVAVGTGRVVFGAGYIYVLPPYQGSLISINIATGQSTAQQSSYISGGVFDPAVNAIYSASNGLSPNSLTRFDAANGVLGNSTSQPSAYFSVFNICSPLWISHDGATIYSACGPVYRASNTKTADMRYLGILPGVVTSQSLATSDSLSQIAVIPAMQPYSQTSGAPTDTVVNLYSSSSFNFVGKFATTPFRVNATSFPAHGRWVFYNSASSALFIITQSDSSAGLIKDYAIENVNLTNANSCNATFGTTSASPVAAGSYQTAQILSGQDCVFTALSDVPWITLSSGYSGSGNTTLTYLVRPNLSGASRSGTISLGSATLSVVQDAAGTASTLNPLSFKPVAAAYDKPLDKIVMVSASPNELHVYDPVTQADQTVSLNYIPLSLSVRPDGLTAAVGHSGKISIVDLQAKIVSQTILVDMDNGGIALASNGYAYAFPSQTNTWATINSVQLSNGALTPLQDIYYGNTPRLDASGNYLYVGGGSGSSKLNISNGPAALVSAQYGVLSGNIWLSEAGDRLITSTGNVLFASNVPAQDLQPDGQLSGTRSVNWAADSQIQQQIAVLADPSGTTSNTQLQIYAENGLQLVKQAEMPAFSNGGTNYVSHGRYVFWNADASKLFAITQADSASGLLSDYAVYTIAAPESLSGCNYAVSPTTLNVPSSYSTWVIGVTSNCSWTATTSGGNWFYLTNSGAGVGNTQVTLYTQNNSGGARSGSLIVGNQTVTINQAPVTCVYTLSPTYEYFPPSGGTGIVNLTTGASCPWSAQSNSPWLTVGGSQSGTGPASIPFLAAASPVSRYGSLNIAGLAFGVTQTSNTGPGIFVTPGAVQFGNANLLTRGAAQTITISNPTPQTITIGNISLTGAGAGSFSFGSSCADSVAPGATCSLKVTFTPLLPGYQYAALSIPINVSGTPVNVSLSGQGQLNGAFEIMSVPTGKVLEALSGSGSNGAAIAQNALNGFQQQQWLFIQTADGYYIIENALTGKVLDVTEYSLSSGTLIQQWDYTGGANQQWRLTPIDDVHYSIVNRNSGLVLDVPGASTADGAQIQQWSYLGDPQQRWVLVPVGSYNIANALSSYVLDVPGGSTSNGSALQQWSPNGNRQQQWQFVPVGGGYSVIMNRNSGKVLDVTLGSTSNGALIQQWDYLQAPNQQWQIVPVDGSNYEIVNRESGYVLDDMDYSTQVGTQIQQWTYGGTKNQQWQITPVVYYNVANQYSGLVLDVVGGSPAGGADVQQSSSNGLQQQQWQLVPLGNSSFAIMNNLSSKVLDVMSSSSGNGLLVQQNDYSGDSSQQWQFFAAGSGYYEIKNVGSGKALDMTGFALGDGGLLQQWDYLAGRNQQWQLVPVSY